MVLIFTIKRDSLGRTAVRRANQWLRRMGECELQEIFKQDAAVARFVLVLPARAALVPVFERLLQVKLDRVNKLTIAAFHHHLITAKI